MPGFTILTTDAYSKDDEGTFLLVTAVQQNILQKCLLGFTIVHKHRPTRFLVWRGMSNGRSDKQNAYYFVGILH